jgi:hypothetical protein
LSAWLLGSTKEARIETLDHIHTRLDRSELEAYSGLHHLSDEGTLERLLALNLERKGKA